MPRPFPGGPRRAASLAWLLVLLPLLAPGLATLAPGPAAGAWPRGAAPLAAEAPTILGGEFWAELEPVSQVGDPWPLKPEDAALRLVEEAAYVFAGMVSGFEFSYTPLDRVRGLEERFSMKPLGQVPRGDPRLVPGAARVEGQRVIGRVEFLPDPNDRLELEAFAMKPWRNAQGRGGAELVLGVKGRRAAYEDAARAGVRELLRGLEANKPRLARGRLVFAEPPRVAVVEGRYVVSARLRVEVVEVLSYGVY